MKKYKILSLFVLANAMLLSACGNNETSENVPSNDGSSLHEHSLKSDAPYCEGCGKYVVGGEEYDLTKCTLDSVESEYLSYYSHPLVQFKTGKNLFKVVSGEEDEMHFEVDCGFIVTFYQTAEALNNGDWNQDVKVASCTIYGKDGNKLADPENDVKNSGQYNFWGTEETYIYSDDLYVVVEVNADVAAYVYIGDC